MYINVFIIIKYVYITISKIDITLTTFLLLLHLRRKSIDKINKSQSIPLAKLSILPFKHLPIFLLCPQWGATKSPSINPTNNRGPLHPLLSGFQLKLRPLKGPKKSSPLGIGREKSRRVGVRTSEL